MAFDGIDGIVILCEKFMQPHQIISVDTNVTDIMDII
jgi:hypothetical protein